MIDYARVNGMELAGLDPNYNTNVSVPVSAYYNLDTDSLLMEEWHHLDSSFTSYTVARNEYYMKKESLQDEQDQLEKDRLSLFERYAYLKAKIDLALANKSNLLLAQALIENNLIVLTKSNNKKKNDFFVTTCERDSLSSSRISLIAQSLYPNRKVVVIAHNAHIAQKGYFTGNDNCSYGSTINSELEKNCFRIATISSHLQRRKPKNSQTLRFLQSKIPERIIYIPTKTDLAKRQLEGIYLETKVFEKKYKDAFNLFDGLILIKDATSEFFEK